MITADNVNGLSNAKSWKSICPNEEPCIVSLWCTASSLSMGLTVTSNGRSLSSQDAQRGNRVYVLTWLEFPRKSSLLRKKVHNYRKDVKTPSLIKRPISPFRLLGIRALNTNGVIGASKLFCFEFVRGEQIAQLRADDKNRLCTVDFLHRNSLFAAQRRCWAWRGWELAAGRHKPKRRVWSLAATDRSSGYVVSGSTDDMSLWEILSTDHDYIPCDTKYTKIKLLPDYFSCLNGLPALSREG